MVCTGCATPAPPIVTVKQVEIPVRVPCLTVEQIPVEPKYALDDPAVIDMNLDQQGTAALIEIEQRRDWQRIAKALLQSCAK